MIKDAKDNIIEQRAAIEGWCLELSGMEEGEVSHLKQRGEQDGSHLPFTKSTAICLFSLVLPIKVQSSLVFYTLSPPYPVPCLFVFLIHSITFSPSLGYGFHQHVHMQQISPSVKKEPSLEASSCSGDSFFLLLSQTNFWKAVSTQAVFSSCILICTAVHSGLYTIPPP